MSNSKRYWTLDGANTMLTLLDPEKHYRAYVKHDGMVHIWLYEDSDRAYDHDAGIEDWGDEIRDQFDYYWCVGDLDDVIARLQALRTQATQWFIAQGKPVPEPTWLDIVWQERNTKQATTKHSWSVWSAKEAATPISFLPMQGVRFFCTSSTCHDRALPLQANVATDSDAPSFTFVKCPECQQEYRVTWKHEQHAGIRVESIVEVKHDH